MSHTISRGCAILLILAAIVLGACVTPTPTKSPPPADWPTRWLRGIPCSPPCWEGMIPGETTAAEAVEIWRASPVIDTVEISIPRIMPDRGIVTWTWVGGKDGGEAIFHAQTTDNPIYIIHPYLPTSFKLGDIIQAYGEPSHVAAIVTSRPDDDGIDYSLSILYRLQGFILFEVLHEGKPILNEDTPFHVSFFALNDEGLRAAIKETSISRWGIPWQGMKDYDFYCRDERGNPCP
ncbi:MAG: hypothetical protein KKA73_14725 [Chloroflexi bacterium]|nr:hypothetical protein [Chloroflexota bacterium]MBU1748940.1 hypothetical protein [Chloroflexota bacterium]